MEKSAKSCDNPRALTSRIYETEANLEKKKKILGTVNINVLPDRGDKLIKQIEELENLLDTLKLEGKNELEKAKKRNSKDDSEKLVPNKLSDCDKNNGNIVTSSNEIKITDAKLGIINVDKKKLSSNISKNTATHLNRNGKSSDQAKLLSSNPIFKESNSDMPSFAQLSKTSANVDPEFEKLVNSPSFKSFRQPDKVSSIKLTEAKPLFPTFVTGKKPQTIYTTVHPELLANEETVKKLHHSLSTFPDDVVEESAPASLKTRLMKHQIKALSWLVWREGQQPSGGILADDMGLGKTLTIISLLLKQKEEGNFLSEKNVKNSRGTLIVCLASIVHQWKDEILKHCEDGSLEVLLYHGPKREKDINKMKKYDVVLTTYHTLLSEKKALESKDHTETGLYFYTWERVVLDEAHTIKNYKSQIAESVFGLKSHRKWCMTGTPIHNKLTDMYSLVKFLQFSPFDDYTKWKKLTSDETTASKNRRNLLVKSILLRRTKEDADETGTPLIKMVGKSMSVLYLELSEEEMNVYNELNSKIQNVLNRYLSKTLAKVKSSTLLVLLLRLQQCCGHLSLLGKDEEEDDGVNDSLNDLSLCLSSLNIKDESSASESGSMSSLELSLSEFQAHDLSDHRVMSTKIKKLFNMLKEISVKSGNTDKSVIVSQWVGMLNIVAFHLQQEEWGYHMIAGSTKPEDRQKASDDFNNNPNGHKVMLLSLKAGGVGLNLIGGNNLFLLDLHWNPALERQACDRIHRVGQTKEVCIYKFICKNTIEERILAHQKDKSDIASDALHGGGKMTQGLSMDDFRTLFNVRF